MKRETIEMIVNRYYTGDLFPLVCDLLENSLAEQFFKIDKAAVLCAVSDVTENN